MAIWLTTFGSVKNFDQFGTDFIWTIFCLEITMLFSFPDENFVMGFVPYFEILLAVCPFGISLALKNFDQFGTDFIGTIFCHEFTMFSSLPGENFCIEFVPYC